MVFLFFFSLFATIAFISFNLVFLGHQIEVTSWPPAAAATSDLLPPQSFPISPSLISLRALLHLPFRPTRFDTTSMYSTLASVLPFKQRCRAKGTLSFSFAQKQLN